MNNSATQKGKSGTGFFVEDNIIVTNWHVVKETTYGYAKIYNSEKVYDVLKIVLFDEENDLALLKVNAKGNVLKLNSDDTYAIGDDVFVGGNPEGLEGTFSTGILSSKRHSNGVNLLQITAPISHGSSGSPVVNERGEIIGVAVSTLEDDQSLNFAIPVSVLRNF